MASDAAKGLSSAGEYSVAKGTSFFDATTVRKRGQESVYEAVIPSDWCFGPVAHGGYLSSLLSRAVTQHVASMSTSASTQLPNTLSSCSVTYLAPVLPGSVEITIQNRSLTKSSAHFLASLHQSNVKTSSEIGDAAKSVLVLRAEATILMTTAHSMNKSTLPRAMNPRNRILASEVYAREPSGHHVPHHDSGMSFYKHKPDWECYFRPESIDKLKMLNQHPDHGPAVFDVWWKLDHDITVHELGFLADLIGPVLFNYEDVRRTHWLSTKQMSVEVLRLPQQGQSGWKWLFCRMELIENAGDRFYCDVTMADEDGVVVGLARQSCVVRPFELVGKSKADKKNKAGDQKAKI